MSSDDAPRDVRLLAERRRAARAERDWAEADRLKGEIEAAGWRIVDQGRMFTLHRAHPPDLVEHGVTRYGASASVPSVLADPPSAEITLVRAIPDDAPTVAALDDVDPRIQTVLVADQPLAALPAGDPEVVLLHGWLGTAAALNAGLRRARGGIIAIADPALRVGAPQLRALAAALEDPAVAVVGPWGWRSADLRHLERAAEGEATAIDGRLQVFRRADHLARGPLDEDFTDPHRLDLWWSLVLRDEGPDRPPRDARIVDVGLASEQGPESPPDLDRTPSAGTHSQRRNFYRVIRRFGGARHLAHG